MGQTARRRTLNVQMSANLNPEKALIFRIVHRDGLPWIFENGLHAKNGEMFDPQYRNIGNPDLIDRRSRRVVPIPPDGTLSDYIPFYFTPFSIMMYNINTGYGGIKHVPNDEIAILVSSLHRVKKLDIPFVFTNQHAYPAAAEFFSDLSDLDRIDWPLLQSRNFKHDPDDPGKKERYQAEALIWKHLPLDALLGVCCYNKAASAWIQSETARRQLQIQINTQPGWYF
jgi:hypothetical protein